MMRHSMDEPNNHEQGVGMFDIELPMASDPDIPKIASTSATTRGFKFAAVIFLSMLGLVVGVGTTAAVLFRSREEKISQGLAEDPVVSIGTAEEESEPTEIEGVSTTTSSTSSSTPSTSSTTSASSTSTPTQAPTASPHYDTTKGCLPDRLDNEGMDLTVDPDVNFNRLYPGQFLCSKPYRQKQDSDKVPQQYRFGVDEDTGDVIWRDTVADETVTVMENPIDSVDTNHHYLTLTTNGTMVYHYENGTQELHPTNLKHPMQTKPSRCLSNHDCPYFHLHSEGVMVLNYIAEDGTGWEARNFLKAYEVP